MTALAVSTVFMVDLERCKTRRRGKCGVRLIRGAGPAVSRRPRFESEIQDSVKKTTVRRRRTRGAHSRGQTPHRLPRWPKDRHDWRTSSAAELSLPSVSDSESFSSRDSRFNQEKQRCGADARAVPIAVPRRRTPYPGGRRTVTTGGPVR